MYPRLEIDLIKLDENAKILLSLCQQNGIDSCFLVTKLLAGYLPVVKHLSTAGFSHLADSRIENLKKFRKIPLPKVLLRLPMASEIRDVVRFADFSLNSEWTIIQKLDQAAQSQNKVHGIILMFDLGDLREGLFYQNDYLNIVKEILKLKHIKLEGIGTNLTCYGGVIPDAETLSRLINIKHQIEKDYQIKLSIISGGNSSMVHLFGQGVIPEEINNLRIGEAFFLGRETAYGNPISGMHQDAFILKAEVIESQWKPSFPIGHIGMNSFGDVPLIPDQGRMERGIVAVGRQDVEQNNLIPTDDSVKIIGASSDHLIVDLTKTHYGVGNILSFKADYPGVLRLMTSPYVKKHLVKK